ncbi:MAG: xanthine dehydrogenase family protein subunit M [Armatimonadota bacterium]|nr:xanthine dehydrogenase family protein subunit M [Armatimonadota bacterium]
MLRLPPFQYVRPGTLHEAVGILASEGGKAVLMAGGTDLLPRMKHRVAALEVVVAIRALRELRGIWGDPRQGLVIGAASTLAEVCSHPAIRQGYEVLSLAAAQVATPQIRNMGTIGGNLCLDTRCSYYDMPYTWRKAMGFCLKKNGDTCLVAPGSTRCWAVSSSDLAPVLMALDGRVRLVGPRGERVVPVEELYRDDGIRYLNKEPAEILTEVLLPPLDGWKAAYWKVRRRGSFDFPVLSLAVAVRQDEGGHIADARLILGAVRSSPLRVREAEEALRGEKLEPGIMEVVCELASRAARPVENTDFTVLWRKRMVKVFLRRALGTFA